MANESINSVKSIIENGMDLGKSTLTVTHDILINGIFKGKIVSTGKVFVDVKAEIEGSIVAKEVDFRGKLSGECIVEQTVTFHPGSKFTGSLKYGIIVTDVDTIIEGPLKHNGKSEYAKVIASNKVLNKLKKDSSYHAAAPSSAPATTSTTK